MPAPKPGSAHDHTIDRRDVDMLVDEGRHASHQNDGILRELRLTVEQVRRAIWDGIGC